MFIKNESHDSESIIIKSTLKLFWNDQNMIFFNVFIIDDFELSNLKHNWIVWLLKIRFFAMLYDFFFLELYGSNLFDCMIRFASLSWLIWCLVPHLSAYPWYVVCSPFYLTYLLIEILKKRKKIRFWMTFDDRRTYEWWCKRSKRHNWLNVELIELILFFLSQFSSE